MTTEAQMVLEALIRRRFVQDAIHYVTGLPSDKVYAALVELIEEIEKPCVSTSWCVPDFGIGAWRPE